MATKSRGYTAWPPGVRTHDHSAIYAFGQGPGAFGITGWDYENRDFPAHVGSAIYVSGHGSVVEFRPSASMSYLLPDVGLAHSPYRWNAGTISPRDPDLTLINDGVELRLLVAPYHLTDSLQVLHTGPDARAPVQAAFENLKTPLIVRSPSRTNFLPVRPRTTQRAFNAKPREIPTDRRSDATEAVSPLPADATVEQIATRLRELSGLSDGDLARLFRVARETYQRWRTGDLKNPTPGNRRRLGLLLRLFQELHGHRVDVREWLRNVADIDGVTPYQLLEQGRIDKVAYLAMGLGQDAGVIEWPGKTEDEAGREEIIFSDDDGWEIVQLEAADEHD